MKRAVVSKKKFTGYAITCGGGLRVLYCDRTGKPIDARLFDLSHRRTVQQVKVLGEFDWMLTVRPESGNRKAETGP